MPKWFSQKHTWVIIGLLFLIGCGIWLYYGLEYPRYFAADAVENQVLPQNADAPTIIVVGDQAYPPFEFINEYGEPDGFNIELIREVAKVKNLNIQIKLMSPIEAQNEVISGKADIISGMPFSPDRDGDFDFSLPHSELHGALFVKSGSSIKAIDDLAGKRIAVEHGDIAEDYLRSLPVQVDIQEVDTPLTALQGVESDTYDGALLTSMLQGLMFLDDYKIRGIQVVTIGQQNIEYGFAVANGRSDLLYKLNDGLQILKETGKYQEIHKEWLGVYEEKNAWYNFRYVGIALTGLGILLSLAVLWSSSLRQQVRRKTNDLRQSEQKYRLLVENANEGVIVSIEDKVVFVNQRAAEITEISSTDMLDGDFFSWIHPDYQAIVREYRNEQLQVTNSKNTEPIQVITVQNHTRWFYLNPVSIEWEGKPAVLDMISDVTGLKLAEEQIRRQVDQLAALRNIDQAITGSLDLSVTLTILLEQVVLRLGVDAADILIYNPMLHQLFRVSNYGLNHRLSESISVYMGSSLPGQVILTRESIIDHSLEENQNLVPGSGLLLTEHFTSYSCIPLLSKNKAMGILEIFNAQSLTIDYDWQQFLDSLTGQAAIAIENSTMYQDLQRANENLVIAYDSTIAGWARALELRDQETEGHSQRVARMTVALAYRMGLRGEEITDVRRGALLHDIGKMGIPDDILLKNGQLTSQEWEVMRKHPVYAKELLSDVQFLIPAMAIPYSHHERWDGSGYPLGLKGDQIPLPARIFAVIDVWDALSNDRPYRPAWETERVVTFLIEESGHLFDPTVVEVFLEMRDQWEIIIPRQVMGYY